jgi:host factor-I protein
MRISPRRLEPASRLWAAPHSIGGKRIFIPGAIALSRNHTWRRIVNRKLIRTTLADVKARRDVVPQQNRMDQGPRPGGGPGQRPGQPPMQMRKRQPPPTETHAEIYYYKKQIDAHTPMVLVLQDGEEIEGTIEWYDRGALKINRRSAPNLLILKRNIKYMYKVEERLGKVESDTRSDQHADDDEAAEPAFFEN